MAKIIKRDGNKLVIEIEMDLFGDMLSQEEAIQLALNEAGKLATIEAFSSFEEKSSHLEIDGVRLSSKGFKKKNGAPLRLMSPYGKICVHRQVFQSSQGGACYYPSEQASHLIKKTTPRMAKMVSQKYSNASSRSVVDDFQVSHCVSVSPSFVRDLSDGVLDMIVAQELCCNYELPCDLNLCTVASVAISLDGVYVPMVDEGFREAMSGSISLYDQAGQRLHSIYVATSPEHGKAAFEVLLAYEIGQIKAILPEVTYLGVADGASSNWLFLEEFVSLSLIDYYHASGYLADFAKQCWGQSLEAKTWFDKYKTILKEKENGVKKVLKELQKQQKHFQSQDNQRSELQKIIQYFKNKSPKMNYYWHKKNNYPIGSGVVEAACKTLVKNRTNQSGMRWKNNGMDAVLTTRALHASDDRWNQCWKNYMAA